ncbi:choline ABC transporter, periplasmic binding family protein, partial [Vibrio parahaemolyticus VPTS-2010_2]
KT